MDIQKMFEDEIATGLFTDFDVCVRGPVEIDCSGGCHVERGATLFDVSSLTKASAYLLMWKLFFEKTLSPDDALSKFLPDVPNTEGRALRDFMSYIVQDYGFNYQMLRRGSIGPFKDVLLKQGFAQWNKKFAYDNFASAYIGLLLEKIFEQDIEGVLRVQLAPDPTSFIFNPVFRNILKPELVVPTRTDEGLRGLVHDPLSSAHQEENIVSAGLFSNARTIAEMFHRILQPIVSSSFYDMAVQNQLEKYGISDYEYSLGFDIPYQSSLRDVSVDTPLVFAGFTGCRIFFARKPQVTICVTTNRAFCADTTESRKKFSEFFWGVIRQVLRVT